MFENNNDNYMMHVLGPGRCWVCLWAMADDEERIFLEQPEDHEPSETLKEIIPEGLCHQCYICERWFCDGHFDLHDIMGCDHVLTEEDLKYDVT